MSSLLRKKPVQSQPKEEKKEPKENVPAKGAPQVPKVTECAGCGDAFTSEDLTQYKQKWYCNPCLAAKKADAKASKRGLFVEANGGGLFLHAIGEVTPGWKAKLRV